MKPKQFFDLVSEMRKKQKQYFATRDKSVLVESKNLERRVDEEIERANNILQERLTRQAMNDPFINDKL